MISFFKKFIKNILSLFLWKLDDVKFYYLYKNTENIYIYGKGNIIIGENSYIGQYSSIQAEKRYHVKIGKNCQISHNVRIYTTTMNAEEFIKGKKIYKYGNVEIGNNCWIGVNVFINPGVKIGDFVVVGANSVVTRDIPSYSIAVGCPARVIKRLENGEIRKYV